MVRGRKPKPTEIKILEGNPGRRPIPETPRGPTIRADSPGRGKLPGSYFQEGRKLYKQLAGHLSDLGILTEGDLPALELLSLHYSLVTMARDSISRDGAFIEDRFGQLRKHPATQILRDNSLAMKAYLIEFGLTPSSRVRLGSGEDESGESLADMLFKLADRDS